MGIDLCAIVEKVSVEEDDPDLGVMVGASDRLGHYSSCRWASRASLEDPVEPVLPLEYHADGFIGTPIWVVIRGESEDSYPFLDLPESCHARGAPVIWGVLGVLVVLGDLCLEFS